jgi:bacterial/archaeal transporter family-2 protein
VSGNALAVLMALAAGVAAALQAAVNAALGRRIGTLEAAAFQTLVALLVFALITLAARRSFGGVGNAFREPAWLWIGGAMGALIVLTITYAPPRIGTFATASLLISLQLVATAMIDHFGLFGLERIGFTWSRAIGFVLLAAGAVLALRR